MPINQIILVLVLMILGHLLADYPLQGWLATAKAKSYWKDMPEKNRNDYIPALAGHAVMWGIIVFAPIMYFSWMNLNWFWMFLPFNILVHYIIDDLKANVKAINLWQDQLSHLLQILLTWGLWWIIVII